MSLKKPSRILLLSFLLISTAFLSEAVERGEMEAEGFSLDLLEQHEIKMTKAMKESSIKFQKTMESIKKRLGEQKRNACINGANPDSLTPKQYATAFANGPCAPTVLLPGLTGSRLRAIIVCDVLQQNDPETFKACGWTNCNGGEGSPKSEYNIWFPDAFGPASILPQTKESKVCFAGLIGRSVEEVNGKVVIVDRPGITIMPIGLTPETKTQKVGGCGRVAVANLVPTIVEVHAFDYMEPVLKAYEYVGYKIGLSLQPYPYDWRLHYTEKNMEPRLQQIFRIMNKLYSKKVVLVGHSYGNQHAANLLWTMPQSLKDQAVARYIGVGTPFLGALASTFSVIGLDNSMGGASYGLNVGLTPDLIGNPVSYFKGLYDCFMQDTYSQEADKPYIKAILERAEYEKTGKPMTPGTVMDIFPSPDEVCNPYFKFRGTDKCVLNMFSQVNFGEIAGETVNPSNFKEILDKYSYNKYAGQIYEQVQDQRFVTYPNLGVQTNVVFSTVKPGPGFFNYTEDPKIYTDKGQYYAPELKNVTSDRIVTTTSALTANIKWANDFKNGARNSHPVNFIEMCSTYQRRTSVFEPSSLVKKVTKNAYFGIECDCEGSPGKPSDGKCAQHVKMITDTGLLAFLINSSMDGQQGKLGPEYASAPDSFFNNFYENCQLLNNF